MNLIFIYPLVPGILFGTLNWLYWKKQGYTSKAQLGMSIMLFYVGFYLLIKKLFF